MLGSWSQRRCGDKREGMRFLPAVVLTATTANRKVSITIMWRARGRHTTVFKARDGVAYYIWYWNSLPPGATLHIFSGYINQNTVDKVDTHAEKVHICLSSCCLFWLSSEIKNKNKKMFCLCARQCLCTCKHSEVESSYVAADSRENFCCHAVVCFSPSLSCRSTW